MPKASWLIAVCTTDFDVGPDAIKGHTRVAAGLPQDPYGVESLPRGM